jgi:hypothetical protein
MKYFADYRPLGDIPARAVFVLFVPFVDSNCFTKLA